MEKEQVEIQEVETSEVEKVEEVVEVAREETIDEALERINADQLEIQRQQQELFEKQTVWELERNGLEQFTEIIKVENYEDLKNVIKQLNKIVNDIKVANSYQPKDNASQDAYTVHANNKDTKSMIGSKLANLFK